MDPISPINKVFALVSQEEQQRRVNISDVTSDFMAFHVRNNPKKIATGQSYNIYQRKE